jgi:ABC-type transporter Mla MlaB component
MASGTPTTMEFAIWAPIARADLPGLCDRVWRLLTENEPEIAVCDVSQFQTVDAVTVDALARLALAGRRAGCETRLRQVSEPLRQLVWLMGLDSVLVEV